MCRDCGNATLLLRGRRRRLRRRPLLEVLGAPMTALDRLLRSLTQAGCHPRPAGPGIWFARCPSCMQHGWHSLIEIRETDHGVVVCCGNAHEPPHEVAA